MSWKLYQSDDTDYECKEDRSKDTAEEWLVYFDKGSDREDCPHKLEPEHGEVVYRIVTFTGEICCRVRDTTKTRLDPTKSEPNRWVEGQPSPMENEPEPDNIIKFPV